MAKQVRRPPSQADANDPRAREYFDTDIYNQLRMAVTETKTLGAVANGAQAVLTFAVDGAIKDAGQTVQVGLPSIWNQAMRVVCAYVSNDGVVSVVVFNSSGSPITTPAATYGVRVQP